MESIGLILVLVIIVVVGLPIAAIVIANSRASELRAEMSGLIDQLRRLEEKVRELSTRQGSSAEPPAGETAQAVHAPPVSIAPAIASPVEAPSYVEALRQPEPDLLEAPAPPAVPLPVAAAAPQFRSIEPAGTEDKRTLENRIGSQWFNRIGILAMLIGAAWFLKMAIDNQWIGPLGRVLIGLLAGAALIAWSERFHKRGFAVFSFSLKAIGSSTLYLSLWAAFQLYALMPAGAAFAAMVAVTAFNGYMAWMQDAELLALYAVAGALSTPLLVSTGGNHQIVLFTYLLILDLAALVLVTLKPWSRLLFVSFVGTALFIFAWWETYYSSFQATRTALFLCCFFIPFALAPRLVKVSPDTGDGFHGWDGLAMYVLPVATAALGFLCFYSLLSPSAVEWAAPWLAVAFAAFYLLMTRLPEGGILRAGSAPFSALQLVTAIVFLTIAIPLKTQGRWMMIGWLVEGAVLLWLARRLQSILLRVFALLSMLLGLIALLAVNPDAANRPIFNERFGTYCVAIAVFAFAAWLARSEPATEDSHALIDWHFLAGGALLVMNALILIAFSWEIHSYWWLLRWHGDESLMRDYWMYAEFSYSALFMLFGGALLCIGFLKRSSFLRWQALILFAATIAKVFLVDMSELSRGLRVLSFIGLGILLLCVSYVYQRDWLNLRGQEEQN